MKKILIIITAFLITAKLNAQQNFVYGRAGFSLFLGDAKKRDVYSIFPALTISPGFRILPLGSDLSISLDFPLSIGFSFFDDDADDDDGLGFDAPATVNLNFGLGASRRSASNFGMSFGTGVVYHASPNWGYDSGNSETARNLNMSGYIFQAGFYFPESKKDPVEDRIGFGLRLSYASNFKEDPVRKYVASIGLIVFGDF